MKTKVCITSLLICSCFLNSCQDNSLDPSDKLENKEIQSSSPVTVEESIFVNSDHKSESLALSNACQKLQTEYADLINQIKSKGEEDKELISQLIAWTKEPRHLRCLETDQAYNAKVEELNASL